MQLKVVSLSTTIWGDLTMDTLRNYLARDVRSYTISDCPNHILFSNEPSVIEAKRIEELRRIGKQMSEAREETPVEFVTGDEVLSSYDEHDADALKKKMEVDNQDRFRVPEELLDEWRLEYRAEVLDKAGLHADPIDVKDVPPHERLAHKILPRWTRNINPDYVVVDPIIAGLLEIEDAERPYSSVSILESMYSPFHLDAITFHVLPAQQARFMEVVRVGEAQYFECFFADEANVEAVFVEHTDCGPFCQLDTRLSLAELSYISMEQYVSQPSSAVISRRAWNIVKDFATTCANDSRLPIEEAAYGKMSKMRVDGIDKKNFETDVAAMQTERQQELIKLTNSPYAFAFSYL
jgi:hypothetical protein